MRLPAVALALATATPAFAQSPPQAVPTFPTVTAEATEVVRVRPDQAKVYVTAVGRNQDPSTAADDAAELAKKFTDGLGRLKVKGLKATTDPVRVLKVTDERAALRGGFGGAPGGGPANEMQAQQQVVVTISEADPKALADAVEKVQREAVKEGLTGAPADGPTLSTRYSTESVRVAYSRQEGLDELTAAALTKATRKATARAEAIAAGLGGKLGAVVSADELPGGGVADPSALSAFGSASARASAAAAYDLVEGELVRTVRVRVVFAVGK